MIRKATQKDLEFVYGLYMNPKINPFLLYEMMDLETFKPIFDDLLKDGIIYIFHFENNKIGMFKLIPRAHRSSHIGYIGGVAIHPDFGGKGYGLIMMQEAVELGKEMGLKRIELSTACDNEKAQHIYEKIGFKKEGIMKNFTFIAAENLFLDEILMAYLVE